MSEESKSAEPEFKSAAEIYDFDKDRGTPTAGLSQSPGLRNLENSRVPGIDRSHVVGPQQSAVDPVLAGLDTGYNPMTRAENRLITRMADGANVVPPPDTASEKLPGPSATSAPAAESARADAAKVTPTADAAISTPAEKAAAPAKTEPPKTEPAKAETAPATKP